LLQGVIDWCAALKVSLQGGKSKSVKALTAQQRDCKLGGNFETLSDAPLVSSQNDLHWI